jgi:vacuolar protein sorting-associated protein 54
MKFLSELCRHFLSSLDDMQSSHNHNSTHAEHKNGHVPSIEGSGEKGRSLAYELRKTLRAQSRGYLDALHESFKQRLVSTLDTDRWSQADVSPERQADIERLISGRSFIVSKATDRPSSSQNNAGNNTEAGDKKRDVRPVMIDGVPYRVVWSCLLLCEQVLVYLEMSNILVCVSSEMVARETAPKIADLLRLFDTRTRLLVLGAGAIQSAARLKSISAKHLAFAAQSLGLIRSLLPHIRAALLAVLPPVHHLLLSELDRVTHDYIDHHSLIVNKLVTIAGDSVDASAQRLRTVDWDRYQGQCPYFEEVLKNLTALHRVLHEALPTALLRDIFSRIFALIGRRICAHFEDQNIMPATQTGRQRILDEISHTLAALALLKDTDPGKSLIAAEEAFRKRYSQS